MGSKTKTMLKRVAGKLPPGDPDKAAIFQLIAWHDRAARARKKYNDGIARYPDGSPIH